MPSILSQVGSALSTASRVVQTVESIRTGNLSSLLGSIGLGSGLQGEVEDFNQLRQMSRKLVRTAFQPEWLFRLSVSGAPSDFDLYVKDITYSHFDIQTDDDTIGSATMSWPTAEQALRISVTVRDNTDQRVAQFLRTWAAQVIHHDGTVGLPYGATGYVRNVSIYLQTMSGAESLVCTREMYPIQCGEVTQSRDNAANFLEIPVTFTQFTNLSGVSLSTSSSSTSSSGSSTTVVKASTTN